uniref:TSC22 domain family protein 2 isoform X2 n=1 Tax=Castor canadensis TaxID=51338 RepID=A0A8B7U2N7_CASCN|nr:TSC22 domain family protein 2 isoform X2 [Castor canadensis]
MSKMPAKKKSCFQITSVTTAQVASSITEDTESLDDPDESRTEDLSSEIFDVSRATDYGPEDACERSSSEETLNNVGDAETPGAVSPNLPPAAAPAVTAAAACSSRFRVIKLDHGSGEPFRRGRWTCVEYYERDADSSVLARSGDCIRHSGAPEPVAERDSGLGATAGSVPGAPPGPDSGTDSAGHLPPAQPPGPGDSPQHVAGPPGDAATGAPPLPPSGQTPAGRSPHAGPPEPPDPAAAARRKSEPLPQPPPTLLADAPAVSSLATSVFSIAIPVDGDEDSASGGGVVAIDNKIEQAMDLVKSHLMYAVREEVEVLKEQIKELVERNSLLERENALLKSLSNNDQLSQLPAQQANPSSTSQQQAAIAQPPQPAQPPQQPNVSSA